MYTRWSSFFLVAFAMLFFASLGRGQEEPPKAEEKKKTPEQIAADKHVEEWDDPKIKADTPRG